MDVENKSIFNNKGFSLVEILVSMGLAAFVSLAVMRINQSGMKGASAISSKIGLKMWQANVLYRNLSKEAICGVNFGDAAQGGPGGFFPGGGSTNGLVRPVDISNPTGGTQPWINPGDLLDGSSGNWRLAAANGITMEAFQPDGGVNARTGSCDLVIRVENIKDNYAADTMDIHIPMRCTRDSGGNFLACAMSTDGSDSLWALQLPNGGNERYIHHNDNVYVGPGGAAVTAPLQVGIQSTNDWPVAGSGYNSAIRIEGEDHPLVFDDVGIWEKNDCIWLGHVAGGALHENNAFCEEVMVINYFQDDGVTNVPGQHSSIISGRGDPNVSGTFSVSMGNGNDISGNNSFSTGLDNQVAGTNTIAVGATNIASGSNSAAFGLMNQATVNQTMTYGQQNIASGINSLAGGTGNTVSGANSIVSGGAGGVNTVAGDNSIGVGSSINIQATSGNSGAFGDQLTISGINSLATGTINTISTHNSFASGTGNTINNMSMNGFAAGSMNIISANTTSAAVFGNGNTVGGVNSIVGGTGSVNNGDNTFVFGDGNTIPAIADGSIILGNGISTGTAESFIAKLDGGFKFSSAQKLDVSDADESVYFDEEGNVSIGKLPTGAVGIRPKFHVHGERITIGSYSVASNARSLAIGLEDDNARNARAQNINAIAIGRSALATGHSSMALGVNNTSISGAAGSRGGTSATGNFSFAMGHNAEAAGHYSSAIGTNIHVQPGHDNAVMLGNSSWDPYNSQHSNSTYIVAENYIEFCVGLDPADSGLCKLGMRWEDQSPGGSPQTVAKLHPLDPFGTGTFEIINFDTISTSDKNFKTDFKEINYEKILSSLINLDITTWKYKKKKITHRYIGPVAQDFYREFAGPLDLRSDETTISNRDLQGVTLAATKAVALKAEFLEKKTQILEKENSELKARVKELEEKFDFVLMHLDK